MTRKALIIGSPDKDIPGVLVDMRNYRHFFESSEGGAWYPQEITTLNCPSIREVRQAVQALRNADYSVVVFAGHGCYSVPERCTVLDNRKGETITEHELKVGAPRHSLIIDACRKLHFDSIYKSVMEARTTSDVASNAAASRRLFDSAVAAASPGIAIMYSCNITEGAGDSETKGGTYSSELLVSSDSWAKQSRGGALSVSEAHERAKLGVIRQSGGRQNPTGEFVKTVPRFPFAVKA